MLLACQAHPPGCVVQAESGVDLEEKHLGLQFKGDLLDPIASLQRPRHAQHTSHSEALASAWQTGHRQLEGMRHPLFQRWWGCGGCVALLLLGGHSHSHCHTETSNN